jgi:hypothetical protein
MNIRYTLNLLPHIFTKGNYLVYSHFGPKRSIFRHPALLFSADALHRLQKVGLTGEKSPAFGTQNRYPK